MSDLSICIPAYNYGHYLGYAIESCLLPDKDIELVILDNFSTDNTPSLRDKYVGDERVKWFRNNELLPVQKNWNKSVSLTSRKFVKLLQADDLLLPNFFDFFEKYIIDDRCGIYGHLAIIIDENGNETRKQQRYGVNDEYSVSGIQAVKMKIRNVARFKEPSCNFYKRDAWEKIGGYREDLRFVFDVAFNTKLAYQFGGILINDFGSAVRRHSGSDGAKLPSELAVSEIVQLLDYYFFIYKSELSEIDRVSANSIIQYRILELFPQKFKKTPIKSLDFLRRHLKYFKYIKSFPATFDSLSRKLLTGDIQKSFD